MATKKGKNEIVQQNQNIVRVSPSVQSISPAFCKVSLSCTELWLGQFFALSINLITLKDVIALKSDSIVESLWFTDFSQFILLRICISVDVDVDVDIVSVLYCIVLYCIVLYCIVLYYIVLCCIK